MTTDGWGTCRECSLPTSPEERYLCHECRLRKTPEAKLKRKAMLKRNGVGYRCDACGVPGGRFRAEAGERLCSTCWIVKKRGMRSKAWRGALAMRGKKKWGKRLLKGMSKLPSGQWVPTQNTLWGLRNRARAMGGYAYHLRKENEMLRRRLDQ